MVVGLAGGTDAKFAGSPYPGKPVGEHSGNPHQPIVNGLVDAETLWSCTTCRACVEECPMMIEHVDAIVDMRRHLTLEKKARRRTRAPRCWKTSSPPTTLAASPRAGG
nr:hypothetical protein GCM10020185_39970 [Pseudomonas brassicacearum subsp. brassicacearum]